MPMKMESDWSLADAWFALGETCLHRGDVNKAMANYGFFRHTLSPVPKYTFATVADCSWLAPIRCR